MLSETTSTCLPHLGGVNPEGDSSDGGGCRRHLLLVGQELFHACAQCFASKLDGLEYRLTVLSALQHEMEEVD